VRPFRLADKGAEDFARPQVELIQNRNGMVVPALLVSPGKESVPDYREAVKTPMTVAVSRLLHQGELSEQGPRLCIDHLDRLLSECI
jgi:hypothetical protein